MKKYTLRRLRLPVHHGDGRRVDRAVHRRPRRNEQQPRAGRERARARSFASSPTTRKIWRRRCRGSRRIGKRMQNALRFADEMLATRKTRSSRIELHYNVADRCRRAAGGPPNAPAPWPHGLRGSPEVSRIYDFQDLFMQQQRQALAQLTPAGGDSASPSSIRNTLSPKDLELFRSAGHGPHGPGRASGGLRQEAPRGLCGGAATLKVPNRNCPFPPMPGSKVFPGVPANRGGHGIAPNLIEDELKAAGFTHVRTIESWPGDKKTVLFLVLFTKP